MTAHLDDGNRVRIENLTDLEIIPPESWAGTPGSLRDQPSLRWNPGRLYRGYARAGYAEQWDAFIRSIQNGTTTPTNLHVASRVLSVLERCLEAIGHSLP